jgi:Cu2+-exporting ATPase
MLNHIKLASDRGILIKDGSALEKLNQVDTVIFDKTGTLTLDDPYVGNIYSADGHSKDEVLTLAAVAESRQSHPIARAILREAREHGLSYNVSNAAIHRIGYGVEIHVDDKVIAVGSARFLKSEGIVIPKRWQKLQAEDDEQGYSLVYVAVDRKCCGVIELKPTMRPEAREVVRRLGQRNLDLIIISGDHASPTRHLAAELGIGRYYAEKLPEDKARLIEQLHHEGRTVCFVGDGINDAIALKRASVSISLHGASTAAVDTAQIILMDRDLAQLDSLFDLAASYDTNLKVSTVTTFAPSALCLYGSLLGIVGIPTAFILYMSSLTVGYAVAMWPRFSSPLREATNGRG